MSKYFLLLTFLISIILFIGTSTGCTNPTSSGGSESSTNSDSLREQMIEETGMYSDEEEDIVAGLPFSEEIPDTSPITVNGSPEIVGPDDDGLTGMEFNAAEDYLLLPAEKSNDLTHDGTIEAWLKPDTNVTWAGIIHKGTESDWSDEGYSFQYDNARRLLLAMTSEATGNLMLVHTDHILATGTWSHVVVTWDSDEVHIYVNGTDVVTAVLDYFLDYGGSQTTVAENYPFRSSNGDVVVGTQIPGNAWRFDGIISDVRIYDRFMSEAEMLEHSGM
ncbi:MAG: LamG domain-containing protein [Spirochaetales bacterium]|nr:LamG domain-containing protein [Spirochaetales bacterium]MCF7939050.1 LamG domain-containing protein [Spirochaetales bacterium]